MNVPEPGVTHRVGQLRNLHGNVVFQPNMIWRLTNLPKNGGLPSSALQQRQIGQAAIAHVLDAADNARSAPTIRALGAAWSLSDCADVSDWLIQTEDLLFIQPRLAEASVDPQSPFDASTLAWIQCGTRVAKVSLDLGRAKRALRTSGASNGQTFAGAFSTGTHGAAFDVGALHDTVRGMHLMVSGTRHLWIEAANARVLTDTATRRVFGDDVVIVRDDDIFHSALVCFGSFGVVESVIVETEPLYLMRMFRKRMPFGTNLRNLTRTLDRNAMGALFPGTGELCHFALLIEPYPEGDDREAHVEIARKTPAPPDYEYEAGRRPQRVLVSDPAAVRWLGRVVTTIPEQMIKQVREQLRHQFPDLDGTDDPQPLGAIFNDVVYDTLGASAEIGVPLDRAVDALDTIFRTVDDSRAHRAKPLMGPLGVRFVKGSRAPLALNRFSPVTCTIELPGARVNWIDEVFQSIWSALRSARIPHTLHWGQENDINAQNLPMRWEPDAIERWRRARAFVLDTPQLRARFANPLLTRCGLAV